MKHTGSILKFAVAACIAILLFALTLLAKPEPVQPAEVETGGGMALQPPAFLKSARAQDSAQVDFSFLLDEAGFTAYAKLDQPLELTDMEGRFKTIRQQTEQFISGIVIAPGYEKLPEFGENAEIQVFLHHDGWIVAYLTKWQLASAMFDWVNYDQKRLGNSTLIENVVRLLVHDVGVDEFTVSYYDFRYPEATNLMLVADSANDKIRNNTFTINIPRQLTVYERSWSSAYGDALNHDACKLNDELLTKHTGSAVFTLMSGELTKAKLPPDTNHTIFTGGANYISYCGIAILYREATK